MANVVFYERGAVAQFTVLVTDIIHAGDESVFTGKNSLSDT